ncbi:MAG: ribosome maturation factor RimP [Clostridia bacterium]|nr:ribosome maturation factor RimP [Clostridia bacterium]
MKIKPIEEIKDFCQKIIEPFGIEVVEVEFKQGKDPTLTIFIDSEGGIDLNACEKVHLAIDEPLDELDPTFGLQYTLQVSSLGLDRPFKKKEDFERNLGKEVEVKLFSSIMGKKFYEGVLVSFDENSIVVKVDKKTTLTIDRKQIVKVNKLIKFE